MMCTVLININYEEHIYHSCVHVTLLLHSQSFAQECDWMTSKIIDNCLMNHSLKDCVQTYTYRGFVFSINNVQQVQILCMEWCIDTAFYIMLINSEHEEIALGVSSSSCVWHEEYICHFTRVMQMQESCLGHAVSCLEEILCSDLPLMLLLYQVYEIEFFQSRQVGFEYEHEKCQLLNKQRIMKWTLCHLKRKYIYTENSFFIYEQHGHSIQE